MMTLVKKKENKEQLQILMRVKKKYNWLQYKQSTVGEIDN